MVYYVRFLRPPVVSELDKKFVSIRSVITVTTDLGDISLPSNVELIAKLVDADNADEVLETTCCQWRGGKRTVDVFFTLKKNNLIDSLRVHVTTQKTQEALASYKLPNIFDVWSAKFKSTDVGKAESTVERQFRLSSNISIRIWEETGNTIARHIWDAAIGCMKVFQSTLLGPSDPNVEKLPSLIALLRRNVVLNVVELGAGCGIAGIALAQIRSKCLVHLTDLPEAQEMLQMNINNAQLSHSSSLSLGLLEWGTEMPTEMTKNKIDLVLISDCTYNADSCSALVKTLVHITNHSPEVKIMVAMKRRHDAEALFELIMKKNDFMAIECSKITVPHVDSEADSMSPVIEVYTYERVDALSVAQ